MRFVALDFETSGLDVKRHAPVSLAVALFDGCNLGPNQEWLFAPPYDKAGKITREYNVAALEISGRSWTSIKRDGQPHAQVCEELAAWCSENDAHELPVIAFNAAFDLAWYSDLLFMAGSWNQRLKRFDTYPPPLVGPWHCARMLAMWRLGPNALPKWNLDSVAEKFAQSRSGTAHGAIEDAILAGRIFDALNGLAVAA